MPSILLTSVFRLMAFDNTGYWHYDTSRIIERHDYAIEGQ